MKIEEVISLVESTLADKGIIIDGIVKDNIVSFVESHSKLDAHNESIIYTYLEYEGFHLKDGLKEKMFKDMALHAKSDIVLQFIYRYTDPMMTLEVKPSFDDLVEAGETDCLYSDGYTITYLSDAMKEDYDLLEECLNCIDDALRTAADDYELEDDYSSTVMEFLKDNHYERNTIAEEFETAAYKILPHPSDETLESLAVSRLQLYDLNK